LYLNNYYQWALAESYDENVMHGSMELLLGMEAFGLLHDQSINWNASQGLRTLFTRLQGVAEPGLEAMNLIAAHDPEMAAEADATTIQSAEALSQDASIDDNGNISAIDGTCSFTSTTVVETKHGEQAIGTLAVGEQVLSYNPKTKQMEYQSILHVWIHQDHDLVDLTITTTATTAHGKVVTRTSEVIHTNQKHPFFTEEKGFLPVAQLKLGMHVLDADGQYGVITGWKIVPGVKTMYNLEVAQDHTFTVGMGEWVVHNDCGGGSSTQQEQITNHPDAQSAYDHTMQQIGGPLSDDSTPTFARGLNNDDAVRGLQNGYQDGESSWRLDYDPNKGVHFNWMVGKRTDNMYGAAEFPGTYDIYQNMLLGLNEGGVSMMLQQWAP
jgi:hypothetical protein